MTTSRSSPTIRAMRRKDAINVVRMNKDLAVFHDNTSKVTAAFLLRNCFGIKKRAQIWVAIIDNEPVGFALSYEWVNLVGAHIDCTLDLLFIENKYRGKGIGKALVAHVAYVALRRGCSRVLTSRASENLKADAFYKNLGFVQRKKNSIRYLIKDESLRKLAKQNL